MTVTSFDVFVGLVILAALTVIALAVKRLMEPKFDPSPPMTLGNMRESGVRGLDSVYCCFPSIRGLETGDFCKSL